MKNTPKFGWPVAEDSDVVKQYPSMVDDPFKTALETSLTFAPLDITAASGWSFASNTSYLLPNVGLMLINIVVRPAASHPDVSAGVTVANIAGTLPRGSSTAVAVIYYTHALARAYVQSDGQIKIYNNVGEAIAPSHYVAIAIAVAAAES